MALKEQDIVFHTKDSNGNTVLQLPITRVENVEGAIKTVNGNRPDSNGNISPSQTGCLPLAGGNMTGTIAARHSIDDATTVPSSNQYQTALSLKDKNNQAFGHIQTASYADTGKLLVKMSVVDGLRNGNLYDETPATHFIGVGMDESGTPYTVAPNPPADDDSDQIATTAWVRNTVDAMIDDEGVVHIAGNETISGAKTFSAATTLNGVVNLNATVIGGAGRDIWFAHVAGATSNRSVILSGNAYADGASLYLIAKDYSTNGGAFQINAHDGATVKTLLGKPDGTLTWGGVDVLNPVGTVIAMAANSAPSGYLLCNGAAVSRTTYAELFAAIGTTYGAGDGSTTFNLPNLTDRFIQGSGTAGTVKSAGLPNITGTLATLYLAKSTYTGAFSSDGSAINSEKGGSYGHKVVSFDASRSSSIYGNSTTVQPPALTMRYYIKY